MKILYSLKIFKIYFWKADNISGLMSSLVFECTWGFATYINLNLDLDLHPEN